MFGRKHEHHANNGPTIATVIERRAFAQLLHPSGRATDDDFARRLHEHAAELGVKQYDDADSDDCSPVGIVRPRITPDIGDPGCRDTGYIFPGIRFDRRIVGAGFLARTWGYDATLLHVDDSAE